MLPVAELPLSGREAQLYDLIWKRAMATQMADAQLEFATVQVDAAAADAPPIARFVARGRRVIFPGFFRAYVEGSDDPEAAIEDKDAPLPALAEGEALDLGGLEAAGHETKPPGRYTEASLVKALEAHGVGRPSTYATILSTIQDRGYVRKASGALVPTFTAFAVTALLESDFQSLVNIGFTAAMEEDLDRIAEGAVEWRAYLERFFKGPEGLEKLVDLAQGSVDPRKASTLQLLPDAAVRIGRFGPYLERGSGEDRQTAALPEDLAPADLTPQLAESLFAQGGSEPASLGTDPASGQSVYLKEGPFGPYVQLGGDDSPQKPARVSLPKGLTPEQLDLPTALALLALPRSLGTHPESGKPVKVGIGRFGPYVVHETSFASLKKDDDVLRIGLERALELLAEKSSRAGRGRAGGSGTVGAIAILGPHPDDGEPVAVMPGRYGPYVKHGKTNATLPKDMEPDKVTMEQAVALLAAKAGRGGPVTRSRKAAAAG